MNKQKVVIFGLLTLAAISVAGVLVFEVRKENPQENAERQLGWQEPTTKAVSETTKDKTLPGFKKTGVIDLDGPYKKVTVSDGEVAFSFEVPDEWLTETRNSGEISMAEDEMHEFFKTKYDDGQRGDYRDFTDEEVDRMNFDQLKNIFEEAKTEYSPGYPNASVSGNDHIWYTDWSAQQVDFYIISTIDAEKNIEELKQEDFESFKYYSQSSVKIAEMLQIKWEKKNIDGMSSSVAHYPLEVLENGERVTEATKGRPGGESYFVNIGRKTLLIHKQAYIGGEFEKKFENLVDTIQFEK